ncbi:MAG: hypothetical protein K2M19_01850 [Muribaculaceae bacterium]|nr:hypothetical protein [Muribaculaceae bacterium]
MLKTPKFSLDQWLSVIIVMVTVVGMSVIWMFGCPVIDDYWYLSEYREFVSEGYGKFGACVQSLIQRANTDNIRLPNQIFVFLQPFDYRIFTGLAAAICWLVSFVEAIRIVGCGWRRPVLIAVLVVMWLLGLPWEEYMLSAAFYLNYVVPCAFVLVTLRLFLSRSAGKLLAPVMGAITAWSHEAAGFTLVAGMAAFMLFDKTALTRKRISTLIVTLLFGTVHFLAPAYILHKTDYALGEFPITADTIFHYKSIWFFIVISLVIIGLKCAGGRFKLKYCREFTESVSVSMLAMFCAAGLSAVLFHCLLPLMDRCAWFGLSIVYIGYIYILSHLYIPRRIGLVFSAAITLLLVWHFTAVTKEVFKVRKIFLPALAKYEQVNCKPIFTEILAEKDILQASLGRGSRLPFQPGTNAANLSNRYDNGHMRSAVFIPSVLEDITVNPGEKVPGNNDYFIKDGYLYCAFHDATGADPFITEDAYVVRGGIRRHERFILGKFSTPDGAQWQYAASTARLRCTIPIERIDK